MTTTTQPDSQTKLEAVKPTKKQKPKEEKKRNPNKPLENIKHELFARAVVKHKGNQTAAYQETYNAPPELAKNNASRLIANESVKERVISLLERNRITSLEGLTQDTLPELLNASKEIPTKEGLISVKDNGTRTEALKIALKLHNLIDKDAPQAQVSIQMADTQTLDTIAVMLSKLNEKLSLSPLHSGKVIDV